MLLASHGTPGNIQKSHRRLGVDSKMQEERHSLPVSEDPGLGGALGELLHRHQGEPDLVEASAQDRAFILHRHWQRLSLTLCL